MFLRRKNKPDTLFAKVKLGMGRAEVLRILESEDLRNIGSEGFPPGQEYASKAYARRNSYLLWTIRSQKHFHFYFDKNAKLAKIGKVQIMDY
jgi:hypothetical protein